MNWQIPILLFVFYLLKPSLQPSSKKYKPENIDFTQDPPDELEIVSLLLIIIFLIRIIGTEMKLSQLKQGQDATITGFTELSNDVRKKLMVMGLLPNTPVTLIRKAPMGDPLQVAVRGVSLAVRVNIADSIDVEVS